MYYTVLCMLFTCICFIFWFTVNVPVFVEAYNAHLLLISDEQWRQKECSQPHFAQRMRNLNSDICDIGPSEDIISSPLWIGLRACIPLSIDYSILYILSSILFVGVFAHLCRIYENQQYLSRCSPQLTNFKTRRGYYGP